MLRFFLQEKHSYFDILMAYAAYLFVNGDEIVTALCIIVFWASVSAYSAKYYKALDEIDSASRATGEEE